MTTVTKPYSHLIYKDEFDSYYVKHWLRVQVVKSVQVEGDRVTTWIKPVNSLRPSIKVCFAASAEVPVYLQRTPSGKNRGERFYEDLALSALHPGEGLRTARQLSDRLRPTIERLCYPELKAALNRLARRGTIRTRRVAGANLMGYRLPLQWKVGLPVMGNVGQEIERYGWVEEIKFFQATGEEHPIVRWLDDTCSAGTDELLEPAEAPEILQRIQVYQELKAGRVPAGYVQIPWYLLADLVAPNLRSRQRFNRELLLEIAKLVGIVPPELNFLSDVARNQVLGYLDTYYPGWRTPGFMGTYVAS